MCGEEEEEEEGKREGARRKDVLLLSLVTSVHIIIAPLPPRASLP
jgi:hypothetical protein